MRLLAVAVLLAFVAPSALGADKNEDKAKEAAVAVLKAVKAKDLDAIMKLTTTPFVYREDNKPKVLKETADVKKWLKARLDDLKDADKVPTEIAKITPFAELKDKIKDEEDRKTLEDVIGKDGYLAFLQADDKTVVILVRIKDDKAKVVGIVTH